MMGPVNDATQGVWAEDWTADPVTGLSNTSQRYQDLVAEVDALMRGGGGHCLSPQWTRSTAALIMARLAHVHHLAPCQVQQEPG